MRLNDFCEHIRNLRWESKSRMVIVPPGDSETVLRRFYQERGDVELRVSDLVCESAWLPMPDEIFGRVRDSITSLKKDGKAAVLVGVSGYLALLTEENKRAVIIGLREWLDSGSGQEAVCLLRSNDSTALIIKDIFSNPRYRLGKQLIEIEIEENIPQFEDGRPEVTLVGDDLVPFIPEAYDTFQKYLRYSEDHPDNRSSRRIAVASGGRELAGLNAEVRQVVCLKDFARVFYDIQDENLSDVALRWICLKGKDSFETTLAGTIKMLFFPQGEVTKRVLRVYDERNSLERETLLWLIKQIAPKGSYLEWITQKNDVYTNNFRSAYVTGAAECLDKSVEYAGERKVAILEADVRISDAEIRQFIARCVNYSTTQVAPWLNCCTEAERAELLRRCATDGLVSNSVKDVYPETLAYLYSEPVFSDLNLEAYFREYRELKMSGRLTSEFYEKARQAVPPSSLHSRDSLVQQYISDSGCALLVVDAMGVEWLPMLVFMAKQRNIGVDLISIGKVHLPTSTKFNNIHWPDAIRRLPDIKRFDNIAHSGVELHETRASEENLAAALNVIGDKVLPGVAAGLTRFERVLVTADHGSSRLAVLAWQMEPKLAQTIVCETGVEVADWRYRECATHGGCPPELEETLDGRYWVVRGYNRLPKKGGGQGFELHGGATLEERLVPVVIFSRTGQYVPITQTGSKRLQIVENDDFDL